MFPIIRVMAKVDQIIKEAGFEYHTFVIALFLPELYGSACTPKTGKRKSCLVTSYGPNISGIHLGDITERAKSWLVRLQNQLKLVIVPTCLVGDLMSFNEIVETLNQQEA